MNAYTYRPIRKKLFKKWKVNQFQSKFIGDLTRFLDSDDSNITEEYCLNSLEDIPEVKHLRLDDGFLNFHKYLAINNMLVLRIIVFFR